MSFQPITVQPFPFHHVVIFFTFLRQQHNAPILYTVQITNLRKWRLLFLPEWNELMAGGGTGLNGIFPISGPFADRMKFIPMYLSSTPQDAKIEFCLRDCCAEQKGVYSYVEAYMIVPRSENPWPCPSLTDLPAVKTCHNCTSKFPRPGYVQISKQGNVYCDHCCCWNDCEKGYLCLCGWQGNLKFDYLVHACKFTYQTCLRCNKLTTSQHMKPFYKPPTGLTWTIPCLLDDLIDIVGFYAFENGLICNVC